MKKIKDNRVDAFIERIGFRLDNTTGFLLPNSVEFDIPQVFGPSPRTTVRMVPGPGNDLTHGSLERFMLEMRERETQGEVLRIAPNSVRADYPYPSLYTTGFCFNLKEERENDIGDEIQAWLDDLEAEREE